MTKSLARVLRWFFVSTLIKSQYLRLYTVKFTGWSFDRLCLPLLLAAFAAHSPGAPFKPSHPFIPAAGKSFDSSESTFSTLSLLLFRSSSTWISFCLLNWTVCCMMLSVSPSFAIGWSNSVEPSRFALVVSSSMNFIASFVGDRDVFVPHFALAVNLFWHYFMRVVGHNLWHPACFKISTQLQISFYFDQHHPLDFSGWLSTRALCLRTRLSVDEKFVCLSTIERFFGLDIAVALYAERLKSIESQFLTNAHWIGEAVRCSVLVRPGRTRWAPRIWTAHSTLGRTESQDRES